MAETIRQQSAITPQQDMEVNLYLTEHARDTFRAKWESELARNEVLAERIDTLTGELAQAKQQITHLYQDLIDAHRLAHTAAKKSTQ